MSEPGSWLGRNGRDLCPGDLGALALAQAALGDEIVDAPAARLVARVPETSVDWGDLVIALQRSTETDPVEQAGTSYQNRGGEGADLDFDQPTPPHADCQTTYTSSSTIPLLRFILTKIILHLTPFPGLVHKKNFFLKKKQFPHIGTFLSLLRKKVTK